MNKDDIIITAIELFAEYMEKVGVSYDSAYFRFVEYSKGAHISSQWCYRVGRKIALVQVDYAISDVYFETMEGLMVELLNFIEAEGNGRPKVVVIDLGNSLSYSVKFNNDDTSAMDISQMSIGKENSFFAEGEVDYPDI